MSASERARARGSTQVSRPSNPWDERRGDRANASRLEMQTPGNQRHASILTAVEPVLRFRVCRHCSRLRGGLRDVSSNVVRRGCGRREPAAPGAEGLAVHGITVAHAVPELGARVVVMGEPCFESRCAARRLEQCKQHAAKRLIPPPRPASADPHVSVTDVAVAVGEGSRPHKRQVGPRLRDNGQCRHVEHPGYPGPGPSPAAKVHRRQVACPERVSRRERLGPPILPLAPRFAPGSVEACGVGGAY